MKIAAIAQVRANLGRTNTQRVAFGSPWPLDGLSYEEKYSAQFKNQVEDRLHDLYCNESMNDFTNKQYTPEPYQSSEESMNNAVAQLRAEFEQAVDAYVKEGISDHKKRNY